MVLRPGSGCFFHCLMFHVAWLSDGSCASASTIGEPLPAPADEEAPPSVLTLSAAEEAAEAPARWERLAPPDGAALSGRAPAPPADERDGGGGSGAVDETAASAEADARPEVARLEEGSGPRSASRASRASRREAADEVRDAGAGMAADAPGGGATMPSLARRAALAAADAAAAPRRAGAGAGAPPALSPSCAARSSRLCPLFRYDISASMRDGRFSGSPSSCHTSGATTTLAAARRRRRQRHPGSGGR